MAVPPKAVLVLGALSAIAQATARLYAQEGAQLLLVGRNSERLAQVAADLSARGAALTKTRTLDLATADCGAEFADMVAELGGRVDVVLVFYGVLGNQQHAELDADELHKILRVNFTSAAEWCAAAANQFERQQSGVLVVISSVAGDRGRQSNYAYGAAKSGINTFVQGIAHRLASTRARAVVAKLGYVDTPMTAHMQKGGPLWATPEAVALKLKAVADKPGKPVVYIPGFWWWIMLLIRFAPAAVLHRTKL